MGKLWVPLHTDKCLRKIKVTKMCCSNLQGHEKGWSKSFKIRCNGGVTVDIGTSRGYDSKTVDATVEAGACDNVKNNGDVYWTNHMSFKFETGDCSYGNIMKDGGLGRNYYDDFRFQRQGICPFQPQEGFFFITHKKSVPNQSKRI